MKRAITITCLVAGFALALGIAAQAADWAVPGDFATIQDALNSESVVNGDRILVGPGAHAGATVTKAVEIKGIGGALIDTGPLFFTRDEVDYHFGFRLSCDGATVSHFRFTVPFPVFAAGVDDVTVTQCTLVNPIQGISNWAGVRWEISHNEVIDMRTLCGGGIAILVADYTGGIVSDNLVSHNKIHGTLTVPSGDCGGYNGTGIVLYADFRWGGAGAEAIEWNRVVKNKISLVSDTPEVVDVVAIELTIAESNLAVMNDNAIGFNDLRATELQIALTPESLDQVNTISRNLGDNRGHGAHPSAFKPHEE